MGSVGRGLHVSRVQGRVGILLNNKRESHMGEKGWNKVGKILKIVRESPT